MEVSTSNLNKRGIIFSKKSHNGTYTYVGEGEAKPRNMVEVGQYLDIDLITGHWRVVAWSKFDEFGMVPDSLYSVYWNGAWYEDYANLQAALDGSGLSKQGFRIK